VIVYINRPTGSGWPRWYWNNICIWTSTVKSLRFQPDSRSVHAFWWELRGLRKLLSNVRFMLWIGIQFWCTWNDQTGKPPSVESGRNLERSSVDNLARRLVQLQHWCIVRRTLTSFHEAPSCHRFHCAAQPTPWLLQIGSPSYNTKATIYLKTLILLSKIAFLCSIFQVQKEFGML
jgi:hypothetical protein